VLDVIDMDQMNELVAAVEPPSIETVLARGARIRGRRRRRRLISIVGAGACAALASLLLIPPAHNDGRLTVLTGSPDSAAAGGYTTCDGSNSVEGSERADGLRLLPQWVPPDAGKLTDAWTNGIPLEPRGCFVVPVALTAADTATPITRTVRLSGPSPVPFGRYEGPQFEELSVRGVTADLVRFPDVDPDMLQLRWTESDSSSWMLETFGLSVSTLQRVARNLEFVDDTATARWLPTDMTVVYQGSRRSPLPSSVRAWHANWMNHNGYSDADRLGLSVSEQVTDTPPIAWLQGSKRLNTRLIEVRGVIAVATTEDLGVDGTYSHLAWEETPGITVDLEGYFELDTLVRIATSLEPVAATDAQLPG
jgi:hypothetical protein